MPLEDAIQENTKALREATAAIQEQNALVKSALAQARSGGSAAPKSEAATAPKAAAAPKAATTGKGTKAAKITIEQVRAAVGDYLNSTKKGTPEREEVKTNIQAMLNHFGVKSSAEIPEENWAEAITIINAFKNGDTPNFMNEGDNGDGDEGLI